MDSEDIVKKISSKKGPDPGSEIGKKFIQDPDPGGKKAPDPGSRIRNTAPHARFLPPKIDHISTNSKQIKKRLQPMNQGLRGYGLMKKKKPKVENLVTLPLTQKIYRTVQPAQTFDSSARG
jgi:hypothetical protein